MRRFLLLVVAMFAVESTVSAQDYYIGKDAPSRRLTTEWGVQGGVAIWKYQVNGSSVDGRLGWQLGGSFALNWGVVALQPEIHFVHHSIPLAPSPTGGDDILLKSNSIEVPILLSIRPTRGLRLFAGPNLVAYNGCSFKGVDSDVDFGRVRSTIGYTAGAGITLGSGFLIDVRYNGVFQRQEIVGPKGNEFRVQGHAVWFSFGYIFR
ncbi:MAG: outer membrane beta-barrel protein [Alistipes sp.]|nr:outer membrane beta-barrel protein [Alistipes sp.]